MILGICLGLVIGAAIGVIITALCTAAKRGDVVAQSGAVTEKRLYGYCQRCYEPIITGDLYVASNEKDYCLTCGCQRFKENNIRVATGMSNDNMVGGN